LDVRNDAFVDGQVELKSEWESGLADLIKVLSQQTSVLRVTYTGAGEPANLIQRRIKNLTSIIEAKWKNSGQEYRLPIEVELISK
jgi:hypothetical protein